MEFLLLLKIIYYYIAISLIKIYVCIKWSQYNPWCIAKMNMAYSKYTETEIYRQRLITFGEDFAIQTFIDYCELPYFLRKLTTKDKWKMYITPFSCGDKFKIGIA